MTELEDALHPDFRPLAAQLRAMTIDIAADLPAARRQLDAAFAGVPWAPPAGLAVSDRHVSGPAGGEPVRVRVHRPEAIGGAAPALLFLHGGSFALGSPELEDAKCAELALAAGCVVVSPDYRLAPEHPFPAGLYDARAVLRWLADPAAGAAELGVDPARIAVGGSSAGGCLAAALALLERDEAGTVLVAQLLLCPPTDDLLDTPSMNRFLETPIYDRSAARAMWSYYLGADHRPGSASPYAAPQRAAELAGLPRTFVAVAGLDPLRDEGLAYATRLVDAGVAVDLVHVAGAPHGFDAFAGVPVADAARAAAAASLRAAFTVKA